MNLHAPATQIVDQLAQIIVVPSQATIMGFEVMRALRKGQAAIFNLTQDIRGEARIVERVFGIGASALAETLAAIGEQLEFQPA